jgi:hypothetical protein
MTCTVWTLPPPMGSPHASQCAVQSVVDVVCTDRTLLLLGSWLASQKPRLGLAPPAPAVVASPPPSSQGPPVYTPTSDPPGPAHTAAAPSPLTPPNANVVNCAAARGSARASRPRGASPRPPPLLCKACARRVWGPAGTCLHRCTLHAWRGQAACHRGKLLAWGERGKLRRPRQRAPPNCGTGAAIACAPTSSSVQHNSTLNLASGRAILYHSVQVLSSWSNRPVFAEKGKAV